jgi:hypothetical protein
VNLRRRELRRRELPALTEREIRDNLRPYHGHVKGDSATVKLDRALRLQFIAPIREQLSRPVEPGWLSLLTPLTTDSLPARDYPEIGVEQ